MITVVDVFKDIVAKVSEKVLPTIIANMKTVYGEGAILPTGVHYHFGHIVEISDTLVNYSNTDMAYDKYPAILLIQDFKETNGVDESYETQGKVRIIIVASSTQNYKAKERYDKVFKPVLYPIYKELIKQINKSHFLYVPYEGYRHTKIDRPAISNLFDVQPSNSIGGTRLFQNDFLDAIDITDMEVSLATEC